jgi:hypothetical protein
MPGPRIFVVVRPNYVVMLHKSTKCISFCATPQPDCWHEQERASNAESAAYCSIDSEIEESRYSRIGRSPDKMPLLHPVPSTALQFLQQCLWSTRSSPSGVAWSLKFPFLGVRPTGSDSYTSNPQELVAHCLSSSLYPESSGWLLS